ncbi:MAG: PH domain-containing protein [Planctomycetota bacterium]|nr:PH domain-containing protein [Planctomycetota bacterium]
MTPSGTSLSRDALERLLTPSDDDRHGMRSALRTVIALTVAMGLCFAFMLAIALDAAGTFENALEAGFFGLLFFGLLGGLVADALQRIAPPLTAEMAGLRHRAWLRTRQIPWAELAPVVLTGSEWPYEIRLLDKDGLLVAKSQALTAGERAAVLEAASRVGLVDERTPGDATPKA